MVFNIESLDSTEADEKLLDDLIANITKAIPEVTDPSLKKSLKRTLKAALKAYKAKKGVENQRLLGYKLDYDTLKDFSTFRNYEKQLQSKSQIADEDFSNIINSLSKIQYKRPVQLLKMFSEFPNLSSLLCTAASQIYKERKANSTGSKASYSSSELNFIVELLILNFNYSKNKALQQTVPGSEGLKLSDEILDNLNIKKAGESTVNLLIDFITSVPKLNQNSLFKNLLKILFVESQSFVRERQTESVTKLEYGSDIYQSSNKIASSSKVPPQEAPKQISGNVEGMDLENENLSEEELYNLAIQMSLSQEERKLQEENQNNQKAGEKIDEEPQGEQNFLPQKHSFSFYRFDICKDLFNMLFRTIEEVQSRLPEYGILFKLIYRVLKIQQHVSCSLQTPMDRLYINSFAESLYKKVN